MKKKENNKGITLIALVITIIIMIILVAVSVALAIKGDLFGNAQEGTEKTSIEAEKEQLTEYVYGQYRENADKKVEVNLSEVKTILNGDKDKFKGDAKIEGEKLTVTGNSGVVYTVYKNGTIQDKKSDDKSSEGYIGKYYVRHDSDPNKSHANFEILYFTDENTAIDFWAEYISGDSEPIFEIDPNTGKFINCRIDDSYEPEYQEVITKDDARFVQKCKDLNLDTSNFADTVFIEESSGEDYCFIVFSPNYDKICGFWTDIDYSEPFTDSEDIYTVTTDPVILEKVKNYK